jgi:hypothetical protein
VERNVVECALIKVLNRAAIYAPQHFDQGRKPCALQQGNDL